jgi:hypothetical protein
MFAVVKKGEMYVDNYKNVRLNLKTNLVVCTS